MRASIDRKESNFRHLCRVGVSGPQHESAKWSRASTIRTVSHIAVFLALAGTFLPEVSAAQSFEPEAICRTAIASIMGRDPKIFRVTRTAGGILFLSYVRPIDNFVWDYRCKIQGNRVVWASEPGRWRDDPKDDKVFFEVVGAGKQLRIIEDHGDGSTTKELFDRDKIR
jgi:hypothetical protein